MRAQVYMNITLAMIAILIIGTYAALGIWFINELDRARLATVSADWRNTAILLANRLVYSPNCLAYIKSTAMYDNSSGDLMVIDQINPPSTIDERKFDINRLTNCLLMDSPEFRVYFEIEISDDSGVIFGLKDKSGRFIGPIPNLDAALYRNERTLEEVRIPVKIIHTDDHISYGVAVIGVSVNLEYFEARLT